MKRKGLERILISTALATGIGFLLWKMNASTKAKKKVIDRRPLAEVVPFPAKKAAGGELAPVALLPAPGPEKEGGDAPR